MKKIVSVVALPLILGFQGVATQATPLSQSTSVLAVNQQRSYTLSRLEYDILQETNKIRKDPKSYIPVLKAWRDKFIDDTTVEVAPRTTLRTKEGLAAVDEAIAFLEKQEPVGELNLTEGLALAAKDHVKDLEGGRMGHVGSDGSSSKQRISRYGTWEDASSSGENIAYAKDRTGQDMVMLLIIDDGVKNRGHRTNIFQSDFNQTGVACGNHKQYGTACVMTYASGFRDQPR